MEFGDILRSVPLCSLSPCLEVMNNIPPLRLRSDTTLHGGDSSHADAIQRIMNAPVDSSDPTATFHKDMITDALKHASIELTFKKELIPSSALQSFDADSPVAIEPLSGLSAHVLDVTLSKTIAINHAERQELANHPMSILQKFKEKYAVQESAASPIQPSVVTPAAQIAVRNTPSKIITTPLLSDTTPLQTPTTKRIRDQEATPIIDSASSLGKDTPKKRRVSSAVKTPNSDWKATIDKCADMIETIILRTDHAAQGTDMDVMATISTPSKAKQSKLFTSDGNLSHDAVRSLAKKLKIIADVGMFHMLMTSLEEKESETEERDSVRKMQGLLRIASEFVRESEYYSLGGAFDLQKSKYSKSILEQDAETQDSDMSVTDVQDSIESDLLVAIDRIVNSLEAASLSMLIISCMISWNAAGHGNLGNKFYSEENISASLNLVKTQLVQSLLSVVDCCHEPESSRSPNAKRYFTLDLPTHSFKQKLVLISSKIAESFVRFYDMFSLVRFSDDIVIPTAFLSLVPFFVDLPPSLNGLCMEQLQSNGLDILRLIFSRHSDHRNFILEEILSNLLKTIGSSRTKSLHQFRLPDGKSIQMVSALIMQLIQSCCKTDDTVLLKASKEILENEKLQEVVRTLPDSSQAEQEGKTPLSPYQEAYKKMNAFFKSGQDSATHCVLYFLKYLQNRCFVSDPSTPKKKGVGVSSEAEYRMILDGFLRDVLVVFGEPEWPVAELVCHLYGRMVLQNLDEKKSGDTQIKAASLEWLGGVCGRIVSLMDERAFNLSTDFELETSIESIYDLWEAQKLFIDWLQHRRNDDPSCENARMFYITTWGQMVTEFLSNHWIDISSELLSISHKLFLEYCSCWDATSTSNYVRIENPKLQSLGLNAGSNSLDAWESRKVISKIAGSLMSKNALNSAFEKYLLRISVSLEADAVAIRSKALKALQEIVLSNFSCLKNGLIHQMIEVRLMDPSSSVRDSAVELLGKIMAGQNMGYELVKEYYPMLSGRTLDVGTNVRKRTLKILKDIFVSGLQAARNAREASTPNNKNSVYSDEILIDIIMRLLGRINDEENSVKDLAFKSLQELLFADFSQVSRDSEFVKTMEENNDAFSGWQGLNLVSRGEVKHRAMLLVEVTSKDRIVADLFTDILLKTVKEENASKRSSLSASLVCRLMIDCLVDIVIGGDIENAVVVKVFNLLNILSSSFPSRFAPFISILRPYMKVAPDIGSPSRSEKVAVEHKIAQLVISILNNAIPTAQDPDTSLLISIEQDLISHLNKGTQQIIGVAVPCLCNIVTKTTRRFAIIVNVHKKCLDLLKKVATRDVFPVEAYQATVRSLLILGLFNRYFDFEKFKEHTSGLYPTNTGIPILQQVYKILVYFGAVRSAKFHEMLGQRLYDNLRIVAISSLGHIFLAYPKLMLLQDSLDLMNDIFQQNHIPLKSELLKTFVEFLQNETRRLSLQTTEKQASKIQNAAKIDIKILIGNADEMGDAGVSSSLMQLYLEKILECLLNAQDDELESFAFEAVILILEQGLVHPMMCIPAVVAMETSPDPIVRERAFRVHSQLTEKHSSIIYGKNIDCIKRSFEYQLVLAKKKGLPIPFVDGFRIIQVKLEEDLLRKPDALLSRMFQLVQAKKARRNEFLMNMVNLFDLDSVGSLKEMDIAFCKYLADNLAVFEFKHVEEILHVLFYCSRILSVTAESCLTKIQSWNSGLQSNKDEVRQVAHTSVIMGILLLLKMHLQKWYNISDTQVFPSSSLMNRKRQAYQPSGNKGHEKPVNRATNIPPLDYERLPFATKPMSHEDDYEKLMQEYLCDSNVDPMEVDATDTPSKTNQEKETGQDNTMVTPVPTPRKESRKKSVGSGRRPSSGKKKRKVNFDSDEE